MEISDGERGESAMVVVVVVVRWEDLARLFC